MSMHRATALLLALSAATTISGQQAPTPSADQSVLTVRSGVDAVQIDVFVTDAEGMPVRGLTPDDFEVLENGKRRPLAAFRAVDIPIERPDDVEPPPLAEPDVRSNDGPEGRVYLFVLDEVGVVCDECEATILKTRRVVRQFIERHFGPHDVGAVALLGRGLSTDGQDFTSNRRLLLEAVDKFSGGFRKFESGTVAESGLPGVRCNEQRRKPADMRVVGRSQQMSSLRDLAELTSRLPGQHKAMLIFSECFDVDVTEMIDYNGGTWGVGGDDAHAAMAAATRSNLVIYPIDPTGVTPGGDSHTALSGGQGGTPLEALMAFRGMAEITGGFALINSNSFEPAFERIVRENSTYYMLGFDSAYEKTDGRYVRVQVRTRRPGLTVHARDGYVAPTKKEKQQNARKPTATPAPVAAALASPLATSGVTMRVSAVPTRGKGRNANVAVITDIDAGTLTLSERDGAYSGDIDLRYVATDARRQIFAEVRHKATVQFDPRSGVEPTPLADIHVRVATTLELPPGRYQIRVAAGGAVTAGNVVYDLNVPDFSRAPLTMSGLMLVTRAEENVLVLSATASGTTAKPTKCWSSNCAAPPTLALNALTATAPAAGAAAGSALPTTARVFVPGDEVQLTTEIYDNRKTRKGSATDTLSFTASLRDAAGSLMPLHHEDRTSPSTSGESTHRFAVPLRLTDVPPGAYALDVTVRSNVDAQRAVTQSIPIRIEASRRPSIGRPMR